MLQVRGIDTFYGTSHILHRVSLEIEDGEIYAVRSWYVTLGDSFVHSTAIPPPHIRDAQGRAQLLDCVHAAVSSGDGANARSALVLLWANQHLDALWRLESHLGKLAEQAARPVEAEPA